MKEKIRILFFCEAVTLAHVARPVVLAAALDPERYEIHFAHCPRYRSLLGELPFTEHRIESITPGQFNGALAHGRPLYDFATLLSYVEEDIALITEIKPDIVVGDFRLSLAVSASLADIPHVALSNAYWSPYTRQRYIVPELPLTRFLGPTLAQAVFSLARPLAFALHCLPMRKLRRHFGLKSLGFDLREVYTHADYTLYADIPELYRTEQLPDNHRFIGPVGWSPKTRLPKWWHEIPAGRQVIYVTLGSSGQASLLPKVIAALGQLDVTAVVSTAGLDLPERVPGNVFMERYLPGEDAVKMASLVICNGGSPTTHQALVQGVPVLGLAANLDQYLNMTALEKTGVGMLLRAGTCSPATLVSAIGRLMDDASYHEAARGLSERFACYNSPHEFCRIINEISLVS